MNRRNKKVRLGLASILLCLVKEEMDESEQTQVVRKMKRNRKICIGNPTKMVEEEFNSLGSSAFSPIRYSSPEETYDEDIYESPASEQINELLPPQSSSQSCSNKVEKANDILKENKIENPIVSKKKHQKSGQNKRKLPCGSKSPPKNQRLIKEVLGMVHNLCESAKKTDEIRDFTQQMGSQLRLLPDFDRAEIMYKINNHLLGRILELENKKSYNNSEI